MQTILYKDKVTEKSISNNNIPITLKQGAPKPMSAWLSGTGRNSVQKCKPFAWLVCGKSTFLMSKNKETVEIKVESKFILKVLKANLILDQIRLNIPFNSAIPQLFDLFLWALF